MKGSERTRTRLSYSVGTTVLAFFLLLLMADAAQASPRGSGLVGRVQTGSRANLPAQGKAGPSQIKAKIPEKIGRVDGVEINRPNSPYEVLYDQYDNPGSIAINSQNYETSLDAYDDQLADDFVVPSGQNWIISEVDVEGIYFNANPPPGGPARDFHVIFYNDQSGLPGTVVADRDLQAYTNTSGNFAITINPSVTLTSGHYWMCVQANMDYAGGTIGQWGWTDRTVTSNSPAAWQNPDGGFGVGCTSWATRTTCVSGTSTEPDQMFRLLGEMPIPTTSCCEYVDASGTANCSAPDTYHYDYMVSHNCPNWLCGTIIFYFQVSPDSDPYGAWATLDQTQTYGWCGGPFVDEYTGNFNEPAIPPQYLYYRMVGDYAWKDYSGWHEYNAYTSPAPLCRSSTPTSTPTYTFTPTCTSTPTITTTPTPPPLTGHLTWQGIPQPSTRNVGITGTLTLCSASVPYSYTATTDVNGFFTITTGLLDGTYNWLFKGPKWLASSGTLTLPGPTNQEFGTQRAGDANSSNNVEVQDFSILKNTFGKSPGDSGYDPRADFNNDNTVNAVDFNLLRSNFGQAGAAPNCPSR